MLPNCFYKSVVAAATENNDNGKDDDPGAVIVEKIAKTVVIHNMFLRIFVSCGLPPLFLWYASHVDIVTEPE